MPCASTAVAGQVAAAAAATGPASCIVMIRAGAPAAASAVGPASCCAPCCCRCCCQPQLALSCGLQLLLAGLELQPQLPRHVTAAAQLLLELQHQSRAANTAAGWYAAMTPMVHDICGNAVQSTAAAVHQHRRRGDMHCLACNSSWQGSTGPCRSLSPADAATATAVLLPHLLQLACTAPQLPFVLCPLSFQLRRHHLQPG